MTIDIAAIKARRAAITLAPWKLVPAAVGWAWIFDADGERIASVPFRGNAAFIAAAPADIDALLAEVDRLTAIAATVAADLRREMDDAMSNEWPDLHGDVVRNAIRRLEESKEAQP